MTNNISLNNSLNGTELLHQLKTDFIGFDTKYHLATGQTTRRRYLDSTVSTLMMGPVFRMTQQFLNHYANTHSQLHFSARIATDTYEWAHNRILKFVQADPEEYTCFFTGSGVTAGMNRITRSFKHYGQGRDIDRGS